VGAAIADRCRPGRMHRIDHAGARLQARDAAELVSDGWATAEARRVRADGRSIEVVSVLITEAGWRALAQRP
jgi:hypothetical protein